MSPVRVSTRIGNPISATGRSRLRAMSTASALSGEMYSVCSPPSRRTSLPVETRRAGPRRSRRRAQLHQRRQEARQGLARSGRRDQQGRAARPAPSPGARADARAEPSRGSENQRTNGSGRSNDRHRPVYCAAGARLAQTCTPSMRVQPLPSPVQLGASSAPAALSTKTLRMGLREIDRSHPRRPGRTPSAPDGRSRPRPGTKRPSGEYIAWLAASART